MYVVRKWRDANPLVRRVLLLAIFGILAIVTLREVQIVLAKDVSRYPSPNNDFTVVLKRLPYFSVFSAPGSSGDAPALVVLETSSGKKLKSVRLEMVQMLNSVQWKEDSVVINETISWSIPH